MWAPMVALLLGVLDSALAGQILSYKEAQHSRSEAGVPGTNVTGKWSWVDSRGQQHHVWYVADTGGFRAFGDLVPSDRQQPSFLKIGTPVIGGRAEVSSSGEDPVAKSLPSVLPEKEPIPVGTPVLGGPRRTSDSHTGNHFSILGFPEISQVEAALKAEARATTVSPTTIPEAEVAIDSTQFSRREGSQEVFGQNAHGQRNDASSQSKGSQEENSDTTEGLSKSMSSTGGENVLAQRMLGKAIETFSISSENKRKLLTPSDMQREIQEMTLSLEVLSAPGKGSDFVLIDRLRLPTEPKPRVGPPQIVPQPVSVQNPSTRVIMGLHTSGRPPTADRLTQPSRNLAPLGIHLLNLVPFRSNSKSLNSNGPVPKPIRVVGAPNLENFYRPATLARTTPSPFRLPNPIRDYDYFYSDYDYYDYANYDTGSPAGGPQSTKSANNSAKDNSDESENSAEPEGLDSDEMDE